MISDYFRYNLHGLLNMAAGVFNLTVGSIVLLNNPRSPLQRSFFLFSLSSSIWVMGYGFLSLTSNDADARVWLPMAFIGVSFIPSTIYAFSKHLLGKPVGGYLVKVGYIISGCLAIAMWFYHPSICEIKEYSFGRFNLFKEELNGFIYFRTLILFYAIYISMAYFNFIIGWRRATSPIQKKQLRNIVIGFSIGYLGVLDFASTRGLNIYPAGYLELTILVGVIAFSMIRYQMWNVNFAIKKISLIVLIYVFLIGFSLPLMIPAVRSFNPDSTFSSIVVFLFFGGLFGSILATGPAIYAFLVHHTFWLKSNVTTGLAHELQSPISTINGALEIVSDELSNPNLDKQKLGDYVQMIRKNNDRLESFVRSLLHVAKIQKHEISVTKSQANLNTLIEDSLDIYQSLAQKKNIQFSAKLASIPMIDMDEEKIKQVISNIVSNSIKYCEGGKITIESASKNGDLWCSITDEGCGLSKQDLNYIFDRFYQSKNENRGAGIGLTIAKAWVEAHRGKIWAESEGEGKGTKVTFTLPVN